MHLIMFDIDGTLVDSTHFDDRLFAQSIHSVLGISINGNWQQFTHATYSGILDQLIAEHDCRQNPNDIHTNVKRDFIHRTERYLSEHGLKEIPGAARFVDRLQHKKGVIPAIATGGWSETAKLKLQKVGIDSANFAFASCTDASARTKIMQVAEQRALGKMVPVQKVYFGDGVWDKAASKELNYRFIAVGGHVQHPENIPHYCNTGYIEKLLKL